MAKTKNIMQLLYKFFAGSLKSAHLLNFDAQEIWGKGGGETLALL